MKLWQKTANNANIAFMSLILTVVCLYLGATTGRLSLIAIGAICFAIGVRYFRRSRRQFGKLKNKL